MPMTIASSDLPDRRRCRRRQPDHHRERIHRRHEAHDHAKVEFGSRPIGAAQEPRRHERQHHRRHQRLRLAHLVHRGARPRRRPTRRRDRRSGRRRPGRRSAADRAGRASRTTSSSTSPSTMYSAEHQQADGHLTEDLASHQLERRDRRQQHLDDPARLLLDRLRQQRLPADHDAEHQQPGEDERQRAIEARRWSAARRSGSTVMDVASGRASPPRLARGPCFCARTRALQRRLAKSVVERRLEPLVGVLAARRCRRSRIGCCRPRARQRSDARPRADDVAHPPAAPRSARLSHAGDPRPAGRSTTVSAGSRTEGAIHRGLGGVSARDRTHGFRRVLERASRALLPSSGDGLGVERRSQRRRRSGRWDR